MSTEIESIILYIDIVLRTQLKILINLQKWLQKEKIKSLKKTAFACNNFLEIKEDIQLSVDYNPSCKDFWMYHYRKT